MEKENEAIINYKVETEATNLLNDEFVTIKGITINKVKKGRVLTDYELENEVNYELQKRMFEERASKLRSLSFNITQSDINKEESDIPAYIRRNQTIDLNTHPTSSKDVLSDFSVTANTVNNSNINTLNSYLNGAKPD